MPRKYPTLSLFSRLQGELNRLFEEFRVFGETSLEAGEWQPRVDIVEVDDAIVILAEVPGVAAEDLRVEAAGSVVTLSGSKNTQLPRNKKMRFQCMERRQGRFLRRIQLLHPVNHRLAQARLADGLLTVVFPKVQDQRAQAHVLPIDEHKDGKDA